MSKIQVTTAINVEVPFAQGFGDLLKYAEDIANAEGKNLLKHLAKLNAATGDLAATVVEASHAAEDIRDQIASLMLRAAVFGAAFGVTECDLKEAIAAQTSYLVREGLGDRVAKVMDKSGLDLEAVAVIQ